jgi:tryptophan synthase beta subunit
MHKPDARGYFGRFGGKFVPEVLVEALVQLEAAMNEAFADPAFWSAYHALLRDFVGRPSPIYAAGRLIDEPGAPIVFKREDLNHTGAHKINNTVGGSSPRRARVNTAWRPRRSARSWASPSTSTWAPSMSNASRSTST